MKESASPSSSNVRLDRLCRKYALLLPAEALAAQGNDFLHAAINKSCAASLDKNEAKKCPLVLVVVTMLMALGITNAVSRFSMAVISENAMTN